MSIQLAAKHLAAHGRGSDTTLVHMTPGEVASLQSLAQQHGGSLSINPQTGLPEAGFLSALLPMAAGAGLAAMGMPQGYAALAVGATSAVASGGDLKKGLMAGISAYGGAGMAESFMGAGARAMAAPVGAPVVEAAPAAISAAPAAPSAGSITGSSMQGALNKLPEAYRGPSYGAEAGNVSLPFLTSAAPAQVAQAAAAATPAAQAAQQAVALDTMSMGQRFDALKAGATGTNALNYIKANPFTSLGVATAAMTPDETSAPQKTEDTDLGPRAKLQYYPGWSNPTPRPNMQGIEQTYNRPYYAAEGGITRMAEGGIASAPRNQQQLFADYLARVSGGAGAGTGVEVAPKPGTGTSTKTPKTPPAETPEEYAERMRLNARGGGGGRGEKPEPSAWDSMTDAEKTEYYAQRPFESGLASAAGNYISNGFLFGALGKAQDYLNPGFTERNLNILRGIHPPANSPLAGGPLQYGPPMSEIDRVTADDAANAAYQRDQAEAANLARMQADTNPFGNFADAPLSSRTDVSGYPLRESELKSLERGMTSSPAKKGDPFAGFFNSDPTLNQIGKYADPSTQPAGFFPAGTAYTDKAFYRDRLGNLFAPGDSIPAGTTVSGNMALADQNKLQGLAQQRAIDASKFTVPDFLAAQQAEIAALRAEQAQQRAVEEKQKVAAELGYMKNAIKQDLGVLEGDKGFVFMDKYSSLQDQLNKFDNPYGDRFAPTSAMGMYTAQDTADAINNLERGDRFPPVDFSNQYLSPEAYQAEVDKLNADITPSVPGAISAAPEDTTLSQFTNALYGGIAPPGYVGEGTQLAGANYTGGIPDAGVLGGAPAPNMGNTGSNRGAFGIGGVWTNKEGVPITTRDGSPVMTGAGAEAMKRAVTASNAAANRTYGNSANSGPANDGRADPTGIGGTSYGSVADGYTGGSEAAAGGLSTPYGFQHMAQGGMSNLNQYNLGSYSDGGRLLRGPGDGVSDSIPATIGKKRPARLADGEFVIPARIVSEIGNGSTEAGARKLYAMMDRIQAGRKKSVGKGKVAVNSRAYKHLPA